jgi:hypothetical protein
MEMPRMTVQSFNGNRPKRCVSLMAAICAACCAAIHASADEVAIAVEAADVIVEGAPVAPVANQWRLQFEPMLKVELSFVNRVCKLTDEQRRALIAKSNAWLDKFVADYARRGGQPQAVGVWMAGGQPQVSDPRESIQKGIAKLLQTELPKNQFNTYKQESQKRAEFHKMAFVENLVTRIDNELILSPEQRDNIKTSLTEHWNKSWQTQLEMFVHGMDMWPAVPDQWIRPHLSPVQQIAWGRLNKQQNGQTFFAGFPMEGQVIDDIDLKEAKGDEQKGAAMGNKPAAAVLVAPARAN